MLLRKNERASVNLSRSCLIETSRPPSKVYTNTVKHLQSKKSSPDFTFTISFIFCLAGWFHGGYTLKALVHSSYRRRKAMLNGSFGAKRRCRVKSSKPFSFSRLFVHIHICTCSASDNALSRYRDIAGTFIGGKQCRFRAVQFLFPLLVQSSIILQVRCSTTRSLSGCDKANRCVFTAMLMKLRRADASAIASCAMSRVFSAGVSEQLFFRTWRQGG